MSGMWRIVPFVILLAASPAAGEPAVPEIPGLTVADRFPGGCVDCHTNRPSENLDVRLSTQMKQWRTEVGAKLLAKVQAVMPEGTRLRGKHPPVSKAAFADVPNACLTCHRGQLKTAPPLGAMLHALHLTGGKDNHFIALFQGACTHCHKLDQERGTWSIPSGPEK